MRSEIEDIVVMDVETTGGSPDEHRVIEVAAVRLRAGKVHRKLSTLVKPRRSLPLFITELTGITPAMLKDAPSFNDVAGLFWDFMSTAIFCAQNASFDVRFLRYEFKRWGAIPTPLENDAPILCTMKLGRRLFPNWPNHKLDTIARGLKLKFTDRHRALGDAMVTAQIMARYIKRMRRQGITDLDEILKLQRSRIPRK